MVVVGAGPVGLSLAIDLALRGVPSVVLEADTSLRAGSRAICYAKRSLEILDRLGVGQRMLDKGVTWQRGKVFWRDRTVYAFDLQPEAGHRMPAFVNLQQSYLEQFLIERAQELAIDLRFGHRVSGVVARDDGASLEVSTPSGDYALSCDWLLACDGARSTVRHALGLAFEGRVFRDRFLITDVRMEADLPPERWFWFDPPFHPGQSALLHRQPDNVWRIDLQLGRDADPQVEARPERVIPRLKAMLGADRRFEIEWISIYTFQCRRLARFRHGRVIFLGDAAHQVSPFGARGFNGGIQDADNLAWKLALRARRARPADAARQLRGGAAGRGRREHPALDPLDRVHHAARSCQPRAPRCRPGACRAPRLRAPHDQQRPPFDADRSRLLVPDHAGPGRLRGRRRTRLAMPGCAAAAWRYALLAAPAAGAGRYLAAVLGRGGRARCGDGRRASRPGSASRCRSRRA